MDYGRLFSRAWEICWGHKWLFLLGFLAALGAGGGGGSGTNFNFSGSDFPGQFPFEELPPGMVIDNVEELFAAMAVAIPIILALICAGILIGIALWLLRLTAQAGMISTVDDVESGVKASLGQAFSKGIKFMPRLLAINILLALPIIIFVTLFIFSLLVTVGATAGFASVEAAVEEMLAGGAIVFALICVFTCVAVIYGLIISLLEPIAQRSVVLGNQGVIDSLRHGWQVLTTNVGEVLILAVLYVVIGLVYGIIVAVILIPFGLIVAGPTIVDFVLTGNVSTGGIILAVIGAIILGLVAAVLNAIWVTFRSVSFTLACREWMGKALKAEEPAPLA
jgi:hypothetical protein